MTEKRFRRLAADALDSLPEQFRQAMRNIAIVVEDWPEEHILRKMGLESRYDLLGLYQGTPLPERGNGETGMVPDVITLYRRPIEWRCRNDAEIRRQMAKTLLHEVGHYFGLDEDRLAELGYE